MGWHTGKNGARERRQCQIKTRKIGRMMKGWMGTEPKFQTVIQFSTSLENMCVYFQRHLDTNYTVAEDANWFTFSLLSWGGVSVTLSPGATVVHQTEGTQPTTLHTDALHYPHCLSFGLSSHCLCLGACQMYHVQHGNKSSSHLIKYGCFCPTKVPFSIGV